jgi:hypothetical protein
MSEHWQTNLYGPAMLGACRLATTSLADLGNAAPDVIDHTNEMCSFVIEFPTRVWSNLRM